VLVFMRTKHGASRLARQLEKDGLAATAIHGDKSQSQRIEALDGFKDNKVQILVATDVAARGLDITDLPLVVNFELPHVAEDYVHRIGRTGRAGASGEAISLVAPEEEKYLVDIEKLLKRKIDIASPEGFAPSSDHRREPRSHVHAHEASRPARSHAAADRDPAHVAAHRAPRTHAAHEPRHRAAAPAGENAAAPRDKSHYDLNPDQPLPKRPPADRAVPAGEQAFAASRGRPAVPARPVPALLRKRHPA